MKNRIYGLDPGGYDPKQVETMADWELFLNYYSVSYAAWHEGHDASRDYAHGHISDEMFESTQRHIQELRYSINYLIYTICKRNNIPVNEPQFGKTIIPDAELFMKWYRFYDAHCMHKLTDKEWAEFKRRRKLGKDVSAFLPTGDWRA